MQRKELNLERDLLAEQRRQLEKRAELEDLRGQLLISQLKVSNICSVESKEISSLQRKRDQQMKSYDETIHKIVQKRT